VVIHRVVAVGVVAAPVIVVMVLISAGHVVCSTTTKSRMVVHVIVAIVGMMILAMVLVTIIVIPLSIIVPLGIRRDESVVLVVGKLVVVGLLIVLTLMRMGVVVLGRGQSKMVLSVIAMMVHLVVVVMAMVVTVATTVVVISVWDCFALGNVQPRHFLSVQNLQVLKTLGAGSHQTNTIAPLGRSGSSPLGDVARHHQPWGRSSCMFSCQKCEYRSAAWFRSIHQK